LRKIGIVTLNGYFNYGNRLQNYALQEALKSFDYEVETVWVKVPAKKRENKMKRVVKIIFKPTRVVKKVKSKIFPDKNKAQRMEKFKQFSNKYISETDYSISENYLPEELLNEFDYFVTGSDQVWNPFYIRGSSLFFLSFAAKEKRISYAASFGISSIPEEHLENYTEWISEMEHISVREEDGAEIVKQLTNREVPVVVDPTLLLTKEDWLVITKSAKNKPKKDILLTYFLGEIPKEVQSKIKKYKKKYNLKNVNLADPKQRKHYVTDPAEFLDYIYSAKLFFTDSFHGAVFSILFETPFVVTNRKSKTPSMNSRIETLLSTFKLESRHIKTINKEEILDVDFSHTYDILTRERNRAFEYLMNSIKFKSKK